MGNTKFFNLILNEEEMNAAKFLYELANAPRHLLELDYGVTQGLHHVEETKAVTTVSTDDRREEIRLGKRKFGDDGSTSRSHGKKPEFSFSVLHLLSAVRAALITPLPEDRARRFINGRNPGNEFNLPFLSIHQIMQRVRSRPGDLRILLRKEPLVELVRGVLKVFSSETPPLGARPWRPLAFYDRLRKKWRWIGPILSSANDISYVSWGFSHENLTKLSDQFSIWLRKTQPTLELIASLPEPPRNLMQAKFFEKRFINRRRLNQTTIRRCCDEVLAYFHKEEAIRYLIPDRCFQYTALDGKRSAVGPVRKNCIRATAKSRGHYIFKVDRPPQFSLLSLVRDAAARLPAGMGTRADICDLIRDSQYVIENIPDQTVNQIVSGALDRLHTELDPCVEYVGQWGLWVYLHGDREEEDFAENGTS